MELGKFPSCCPSRQQGFDVGGERSRRKVVYLRLLRCTPIESDNLLCSMAVAAQAYSAQAQLDITSLLALSTVWRGRMERSAFLGFPAKRRFSCLFQS